MLRQKNTIECKRDNFSVVINANVIFFFWLCLLLQTAHVLNEIINGVVYFENSNELLQILHAPDKVTILS